jgi:hypothetical protein
MLGLYVDTLEVVVLFQTRGVAFDLVWEEIDDRSGGIGCALRACWDESGGFGGKVGCGGSKRRYRGRRARVDRWIGATIIGWMQWAGEEKGRV